MASPAAVAIDADPERLRAAASRRSPLVGAAIDAEQAWARARAWAARSVPDAVVEDVRVGWLLYRPDGGCTLRYRIRLAPSGREQILLVEVPRTAGGIVVRPFPADPALPTLPRALDPLLMREVLGRVVPGTGGDRGVGRCAVDVVRHSRRGRCVLRYRLALGAGGAGELRHPVVYGKVYAHGAAPVAASRAARALRAGLRSLPGDPGIVVPRPLAVVDPLHLAISEAVSGEPRLPELLKSACDADGRPRETVPAALSDAVVAAARMAAAVHACSPGGTPLATRDLRGERTATDADLALLDPVWPEMAGQLRRGVERTLDSVVEHGGWLSGAPGPGSSMMAHGDFTPGQVLLDDAGRTALVDVDTLCLAEPALDLGRFLAYFHVAAVRRSSAAWPLLGNLTALFMESYLDACAAVGTAAPSTGDARVLWARTALFRALALARLGASACWQLKDDRLRGVVDVLDAGNDWMRSVAV